MNLLFVGSGKGSWTMRGEQLGKALGARVMNHASDDDLKWADLVVLVKRAWMVYADKARKFGKPIVWDALDCWSQPAQNRMNEHEAVAFVRATARSVKPVLAIGATQAMADVLAGVYLPHHSWDGLVPTLAREHVKTVAYEGNPTYLEHWQERLQKACTARGWTFVVNPKDLSQADILVALRGGNWDGWPCREFKSGVKLVNAIAAGRPVITQDTAAMAELSPCGTVIEDPKHLDRALDMWAPFTERQGVVNQSREKAPALRLEAVAQRYSEILASVGVMA